MNTIQTLWKQVLQSQSTEEERSNIDEFRDFLKTKDVSFRIWNHSKKGEKNILKNTVNFNRKQSIHFIGIEVLLHKSEVKLTNWKPKNTDNVWRLYFE